MAVNYSSFCFITLAPGNTKIFEDADTTKGQNANHADSYVMHSFILLYLPWPNVIKLFWHHNNAYNDFTYNGNAS